MKIEIEQEIKDACPDMRIGLIRADVVNSETSDELWTEIEEASRRIRESYEL